MKPQARVQATIDIFEKLSRSRVPLDGVVGDYMRHRRYIGSKDRAYVANLTYEIMRTYARLGWWIVRHKAEDTPRMRVATYLILAQGANEKRLIGLFDASKYAPEELSPQELRHVKLITGERVGLSSEQGEKHGENEGSDSDSKGNSDNNASLEHPDMPPAVRVECPPLYEDKLKSYFGDDFTAEMGAMLSSATLDLRVNTFTCSVEKAKNYLEADGVPTDITPYSPICLRARAKTYISRTKAWGKGWVEIQDEGSQLIAHICDARPGMQVLDYCAGAGGKTLALAASMQRKGRIVAMDLDERRLMKGRARYKKAQLADIIEVRALSEDKQRKWLKRQKEKFDIVLTDVPCTGTGTWRRNPDMRWNLYGPSLEELVEIQADIMDRACKAVKPGGKFVYATCSLLPDENEVQIEAFLARNPDFEVQSIPVISNVQSTEKSHAADGDSSHALGMTKEGYMRLTPYRHQTDGFFAAVMVRKASSP